VAYGREDLPATGKEVVAQKWTAVVSDTRAFSCINDGIYGSDCADGEMRLSLLRSAAYAGHPILDRPIVPQDRFTARIDQGERLYHFWFTGSPATDRLEQIEREALSHNERPVALSFFPSGAGEVPAPLAALSDEVTVLTACKQAEDGQGYVVRLFEPTGQPRETTLSLLALGVNHLVSLGKSEIKSLRVDPTTATVQEVDLLEQ
jgi:alpha-mannosidase